MGPLLPLPTLPPSPSCPFHALVFFLSLFIAFSFPLLYQFIFLSLSSLCLLSPTPPPSPSYDHHQNCNAYVYVYRLQPFSSTSSSFNPVALQFQGVSLPGSSTAFSHVSASKLLHNCVRGEPQRTGLHLTITQFAQDYRAGVMSLTIRRE